MFSLIKHQRERIRINKIIKRQENLSRLIINLKLILKINRIRKFARIVKEKISGKQYDCLVFY